MPPEAVVTIRCQHCATEFGTKRPRQAKWCPPCRVAKSIMGLSSHSAKCLACEQPFYKLDRKDSMCATCTGTPVGESRSEKPCAWCDGRDRLLPDIAICYPCATVGGKRHGEVVKALVQRMARVKATPLPPEPEEVALAIT